MTKSRKVFFTAPRSVEVREERLPALKENEVLVETVCSAISAGTEMLIYRGEFPVESDSHDNISSDLGYPLTYGYACAGVVRETGREVDRAWRDKRVFAFRPHCSHFIAAPDPLLAIPDSLSFETACFLPNMETAVNLVQDAAPLLGERVLVFGQGIVGLLTSSLLSEFPLELLIAADNYKLRRRAFEVQGRMSKVTRTVVLDSSAVDFDERARGLLEDGADLTLELCGHPSALDEAISLTRFSGRVVIGSWYGSKKGQVDLGGSFHRSRIKLISSQVSTISPELSGRWDKPRRFEVAWKALERIRPEKWITHRFPLDDAGKAYELLDQNPQQTIQVLLTPERGLPWHHPPGQVQSAPGEVQTEVRSPKNGG
ncbi:MAG: zinc-binding alcohol dehydrogenase [Chloroflexota bacterium]